MRRTACMFALVALASLSACASPVYFGTDDLEFEDEFTFCPADRERQIRRRLGFGYDTGFSEAEFLARLDSQGISHREERIRESFICDEVAQDSISKLYEAYFWREQGDMIRTAYHVGIDHAGRVRSVQESWWLITP